MHLIPRIVHILLNLTMDKFVKVIYIFKLWIIKAVINWAMLKTESILEDYRSFKMQKKKNSRNIENSPFYSVFKFFELNDPINTAWHDARAVHLLATASSYHLKLSFIISECLIQSASDFKPWSTVTRQRFVEHLT